MLKPTGEGGPRTSGRGPGNLLPEQQQSPLTQARFARGLFLAVGLLVPATDRRGLGLDRGEPLLCLLTHAAETTSSLPSTPITAPTPARRCRLTPHGCWPSCFPPRMCASEARGPLQQKGSAETGFLRCCGASLRPAFSRGTG